MGYERGSGGISGASAPRSARLMDEVRRCLRLKHYSLRTEQAYMGWIRRFILANGKRHPRDMGGPEVERFLSSLAVQGRVAASTQNQALSALVFLYRQVLAVDLPWLDNVVRVKRPKECPRCCRATRYSGCWQRWREGPGCWPAFCTEPGCG